MEVYIDKDNIISFLESRSNPMFLDCEKLLRNQLDVTFNFPKMEIKNSESFRAWLPRITEGVGNTKKKFLDTPFPDRNPLKMNCYIYFDRRQLSSVYLISDEKTVQLKEKGCLLIGNVGEEIQTLCRLFFNQQDYLFEEKNRIKDLSSWDFFNDKILPCTEIILIDQYILCDDNLYDFNIFPLLKLLARNGKNLKLNIIIVTLKENYNKETKTRFSPNWENVKQRIKSEIEIITEVKPNVTFVLSPTDISEHDRTIFTNYKRIYSGDSFNYFDSSHKVITSGKEIELSSMANQKNHNLAIKLIDDIQSMINVILKRNADSIIGDKKSNFLTFE